ncbi:unnamed protein product [Symbiodinium sp. CCMP2592]|nr:unnamed protein product [Symbiodinium sp. CCMP2592]
MWNQARLLARLVAYCRDHPPVTVHQQLKWDETTVSTTLNPGGRSQNVKSSWSVLVVRSRLLVTWASGASWLMRLVMPTIPLMSGAADQIYYALRCHPSFYTLNNMASLIVVPEPAPQADPLMQETLGFLEQWHHNRSGQDDEAAESGSGTFRKKLEAFKEMWNGSFTGAPVHHCTGNHCKSRVESVHRMATTFIALLLTALPAVPTPNKWTKLWPIADFIGLGTLINNYLPCIFELAFKPVMFKSDMTDLEEPDPRLVEGLFFHAVQGKRYTGSRTFLTCAATQFCCRCFLIVSEHLRRLVFYWLQNLKRSKKRAVVDFVSSGELLVLVRLGNGASPVTTTFGTFGGADRAAVQSAIDRWDRSHVCEAMERVGMLAAVMQEALRKHAWKYSLRLFVCDLRKSAYMFFRDDLLAVQKQLAPDGGVNPCSKAFWAELKSGWESLAPERRQYYEELAEQAHTEAGIARKAASAARAPAEHAADVETQGQRAEEPGHLQALCVASSSVPMHETPYNPWVLASSATTSSDILQVAQDVRMYHKHPPQKLSDLADDCLSKSPVSQEQIEKSWRQNLADKRTWATVLNQFNVECQRFAIPPPDDKFPDRVNYQGHCGVFCRTNSSPSDVQCYHQLLRSFDQAIAQCGDGTAASATKCDILLRFQLCRFEEAEPCEVRYSWVTALSAQSGPHPSSQIFIPLSVMEQSTADGHVKLCLQTQDPVGAEVSWCSSLLTCGPLQHSTEQQFASDLLDLCHEHEASAVCLERLCFDDLDLSVVQARGVWPGWQKIVVAVSVSDQEQDVPVQQHGVLGDDHAAEPVDPAPSRRGGFDLIDAVSAGPGRGRGRAKGRGKGRSSAALRNSLVAELPCDPALESDLELELQKVLDAEHVQKLLPESDVLSSTNAELQEAVGDPVVVASVDEAFQASALDALSQCRSADTACEAVFQESDDDEIVDETMDGEIEAPVDAESLAKADGDTDADLDALPRGRGTAFEEGAVMPIVSPATDDQSGYNEKLAAWEEDRRSNKRARSASEKKTEAKTQTKNALSTRVLKGFLWTLPLLRKSKEESLWTKLPKQTILHFGRSVQGVLREKNCIGAIEFYEDSQVAAVRQVTVCERDEEEEGDTTVAFDGLSKQLELSSHEQETQDGLQMRQLKGKKAKKGGDDGDDLMSLWGVASLTSSGSAGKAPRQESAASDEDDATKSKRPRTTTTTTAPARNLGRGRGKDNHGADDTSSQAPANDVATSSSSWLFGGKPRSVASKGAGKSSKEVKELEATDKVIVIFESIAKTFADDDAFHSVTFAKVNGVASKLQARSTKELQKMYRELSQDGSDSQRAVDVLRRLTSANVQVEVLGSLVAAIHDAGTTSATLSRCMQDAESSGLSLPVSLSKMCMARTLLELGSSGQFQAYFERLESEEVDKLFGGDADAMAEFQYCSVKTTLCKQLNQEVQPLKKQDAAAKAAEHITEEQKAIAEQQLREATKDRAVELTLQVQSFLERFAGSSLCSAWTQNSNLVSFVDEIENLRKVVAIAVSVQDASFRVKAEEVDAIKSARATILAKKSALHESLTLFPVGLFVQQSCNTGVEAFYRDRGFAADLEACIQACAAMKHFTYDVLFKNEACDIAIPGQAKIVEVVQKLTLIDAAASCNFKTENAQGLGVVQTKMTELADALTEACIAKFRKLCLVDLPEPLKALLEGQLTIDTTAALLEKLNVAKQFVPISQAILQKCMGTASSDLIATVMAGRDFMGSLATALPHLVALFDTGAADGKFAPARLLDSDLVKFVLAWGESVNHARIKAMLSVDVWDCLCGVIEKASKSAMSLVRSASVLVAYGYGYCYGYRL